MAAANKGNSSRKCPGGETVLGDGGVEMVRQELLRLIATPLPDGHRQVRSFRALCLRRDVVALTNIKPDHGVIIRRTNRNRVGVLRRHGCNGV